MTNCTVPKCDNPTDSRGLCKAHHHRFLRYGSPNVIKKTSHHKSHTAEYSAWTGTKARCYNPKTKSYHRYGGRGIKVCNRWQGLSGFLNFYEDMGDRPSIHHSLDRINNDGNYEPSNCRWATRHRQSINKSTTAQNHNVYKLESGEFRVRIKYKNKVIMLRIFKDIENAKQAVKDIENKWGLL